MQFVKIRAGSFLMGTPAHIYAEIAKRDDLLPGDEEEHEVKLSAFCMSRFPVTRGQFAAFISAEGYRTDSENGLGAGGWDEQNKKFSFGSRYSWRYTGFAQTDEHPVVNVSWNDAKKFCLWMSKMSGKKITLPTEAQWEYACRAGSKTLFSFGDDEEDLVHYGNVQDAAFRMVIGLPFGIKNNDGYAFTSPVGSFKPNDFGLYDMHGNVWEWCEDYRGEYKNINNKTDPVQTKKGTVRIQRGGSWYNHPSYARSASRISDLPESAGSYSGFRVVMLH